LLDFYRVVVYDEGTQTPLFKMDIFKALRDLYDEKKRLDVAISILEARMKAARRGSVAKPATGRRGRKSMSAAEREEVSKRMTLYWAARRAQIRPSSQTRPSEDSPQSSSEAPSLSQDQKASSTAAS
jgi:hypothetical protein